MEYKNTKKAVFILSAAAMVLIGSTTAFLTSFDNANNLLTIGKVNLAITENFDKGRTLAAGEKITKEPSVKNEGTVNQLFFAEVYVPVMNTTLVDNSGNRIVPLGKTNPQSAADYRQDAEIYNIIATNTSKVSVTHTPDDPEFGSFTYNTPTGTTETGWYFLKQNPQITVTKDNPKDGFKYGTYNVYLFGYNAVVAPKGSTTPIFNQVQLRSMIDSEINGGTAGQVTVTAYTLQADELGFSNLNGSGKTGSYYTEADLRKIYEILENKDTIAQGGN